jgi:hypothetical protein
VNPPRLAYRSRQLWYAFWGHLERVEDAAIQPHLTAGQIALFRRMQPSEQLHALRVLGRLVDSGQRDHDLMAAALLHDVGKILYPLSAWERAVIILGRRLFPRAVRRWADGPPLGLRRPFVVAARHADWGADLAERAGASPRTVDLIRRHQDRPVRCPAAPADRLRAALQIADELE